MIRPTITLDQIQAYSVCPRQFAFKQNAKVALTAELNPDRVVVKSLIKEAYINRSQHGYDPQWETIKSRVNKACFEYANITDKVEFDKTYKRSLRILGILNYWYYKEFRPDQRHGFSNLSLLVQVNNSTVVGDIDIVLLDNKNGAVPIIFNDNDILPNMLYNNIRIKALLWLLFKETNSIPKMLEYAVMSEDTVKYYKLWNRSDMDTIGKYIKHIVTGIENRIYYPSVNEQCNSCQFAPICNI